MDHTLETRSSSIKWSTFSGLERLPKQWKRCACLFFFYAYRSRAPPRISSKIYFRSLPPEKVYPWFDYQ
ncbi:hypothetical protein ACJJIC_02190 [Microbulbifer sp. ANSA002]|uniref:hypothetical protein n=1 Tax=unclassified Microbulbifer TaxID=2619833 RepID=UPI00404261B1